MKTLINTFHSTTCRSSLAGCSDLTELDFMSGKENPKNKKYIWLKTAIIKKLCPHGGKGCACWTMVKIEG